MNLLTFLIVLIGWIFSLCLHEFAHALAAYYGGDYTVKEKGYLTFNPLKYTHPVYSLLLPMLFLLMGGIGLPGGAVYIETWRLRSRQWNSIVSLAGPAANLLVALMIGLIFRFAPTSAGGIWPGLAFLGQLQIIALVLNLIPIPPLDGYRALAPYLPYNLRESADRFAGIGMWILLLAMWYIPFIGPLFWGATDLIAGALGIPLPLAYLGYSQFMFWR
jgi:Zn-dependent protease